MIDMTTKRTVTKTGIDISTVSEEGQFFTFGKITLLKKNDCIVVVAAGPLAGQKVRLPLAFPCEVNGVQYAADIPEAEVVAEKVKRAPREQAGPTKMSICREIYAANADKPKAEVVALFISEAKCTPAGSNTYFLTLKKEFAAK